MITKAIPVWTDEVTENQYIEAKQCFLVHDPKKAVIQICSDADYAFWINGKFVGAGQWRTYTPKKAYDEYNITEFLKDGENELTATAYHQGTASLTYSNAEPFFVFAIDIDGTTVATGKDTLVRRHPHYVSGAVEMITSQLGYSFYYDASLSEGEWESCREVPVKNIEYFKCPVKKLERCPEVNGSVKSQGVLMRYTDGTPAEIMHRDFLSFRPKEEIFDGTRVKKCESGVYFVIDLGENLAGYFTMSITAARGTVFDIGYGEHIDDLRVRTAVGGRNFAARYIAKDGRQEFTEQIRRFGCRYIEIHITNMTGAVDFENIGLIPVQYPLTHVADFKCSDYFFEKLYSVSVKTLRMCMHEHYEDCPWREQALYAYDSYVQMLCGYYAFGEYDFARASLGLLADSQREDGLLKLTAPGEAGITIPIFSLAWIMSLEKYVLYSGDVLFGKKHMTAAKKILDFFEVREGLVINNSSKKFWSFIEWSDGLDGGVVEQSDAPTAFYYIFAVEAYNKLCEYCNGEKYGSDTEYMKTKIYEEFFDEQKHIYRTRRKDSRIHELTQAFAVLAKMPYSEEIAEMLTKTDNGMVKLTLGMLLFKYDALLGYGEKYADYVCDDIVRIYGDMIFSGADTLWETSEGADAFDYAGSLCHAWSAVPVYVLFRYYIGFKPEKPGFCDYSLKPLKTLRDMHFKTQLLTPTGEI